MKSMTLYHALETLSLTGAYYRYFIAFGKYVNANGVANIFI